MMSKQLSIQGKTFFIIEDDHGLAKRLKDALVLKDTRVKVILAYYKDKAIEIFKNNINTIDFIILDIMLPRTKDEFKQIRYLTRELDNIRIEMDNSTDMFEKMSLRIKRQRILSERDILIDKKCGITLSKKMGELQKGKHSIPLIFLTAINHETLGEPYQNVYPFSAYIIKPIMHIDDILELFKTLREDKTGGIEK